jgi:branched-chain amino acid transport system substrate-binding protein
MILFRVSPVELLTAACLACLAAAPLQAQEPLKIGLSGPFTGGSYSLGAGIRDGAKLAGEEINAAGGIDVGGTKRLIQFIERDDQANNELGKKIAQELAAEQKVIATVGFANTGVALTSQFYYQMAGIPVMNCVATGTKVTKQFASPNYIFRNSANDTLQSAMIAQEAVMRRGFKRVAIFADTTNYGQLGRADLEVALWVREAIPVNIEMFKIGETNMQPMLTRAKEAGAEVILTYGQGPELAQIANGMEKLGWKVPMIGSWTLSSGSYIDMAGANSEGTVMPETFIQAPTNPKIAAFISAYQKRFNVSRMPSPVSAAQCYDAVYLLAAAIEQAKSANGAKILEAMENLQKRVNGVVTTYDHPFSATNHEAISSNIPVMGIIKDGRVVPAHPGEVGDNQVSTVKKKL